MLSDEWLPRYRLLENFNIKWNGNGNAHGNGNAYNRGDYNSSFALRAVELKTTHWIITKTTLSPMQAEFSFIDFEWSVILTDKSNRDYGPKTRHNGLFN